MSDLIIIILNSWLNWAEICDNLNTLNIQTSKVTDNNIRPIGRGGGVQRVRSHPARGPRGSLFRWPTIDLKQRLVYGKRNSNNIIQCTVYSLFMLQILNIILSLNLWIRSNDHNFIYFTIYSINSVMINFLIEVFHKFFAISTLACQLPSSQNLL